MIKTRQIFMKFSASTIQNQVKIYRIFSKWIVNSHDGWYEGIKHLTPSTNNGLESNSRVIKDENTFRGCLPLSRFKILILETGEKWSKSYERGLKQFHDKQTATLHIWRNSYQWVKLNKSIVSTKLENEIEFYIPAG
jgi:hypothetical protein